MNKGRRRRGHPIGSLLGTEATDCRRWVRPEVADTAGEVAQTGSLLCRRLVAGEVDGNPFALKTSKPSGLPTRDTADCQSALQVLATSDHTCRRWFYSQVERSPPCLGGAAVGMESPVSPRHDWTAMFAPCLKRSLGATASFNGVKPGRRPACAITCFKPSCGRRRGCSPTLRTVPHADDAPFHPAATARGRSLISVLWLGSPDRRPDALHSDAVPWIGPADGWIRADASAEKSV